MEELNAANAAGTQTDTETRTAAGTGTAGTGTAATAAALVTMSGFTASELAAMTRLTWTDDPSIKDRLAKDMEDTMAKMAKPTIRKAHKIARKVAQRSGSSAVNPYAVGAAVAKKQAAKRKAARTK